MLSMSRVLTCISTSSGSSSGDDVEKRLTGRDGTARRPQLNVGDDTGLGARISRRRSTSSAAVMRCSTSASSRRAVVISPAISDWKSIRSR